MKHKAELSISRPSYGDGRKKISILVNDSEARIEFLEIEIDLEAFSECITGLGHCDCEMEVRGLQNVGKKIENMPIVFEVPKELRYSRNKYKIQTLAEKATPDGWHCSTYFGSQNSFFSKDDKDFARTTASRWVDKPQCNDNPTEG
jgi:hypothetical protein